MRYLLTAFLLTCTFAQSQQTGSPAPATAPTTNGTAATQGQKNSKPEDTEDQGRLHALLPDVPPVPKGQPSLIGGTIVHLDRVRDRATVQVFGGKDMKVLFDGRTEVYRGEQKASIRDLKEGDRVYLSTVLDGTDIFARTIRVNSGVGGDAQGQLVSFAPEKGELIMRDTLSPRPLTLRVTSSTVIREQDQPATTAALQQNALIAVQFTPDNEGRGVASRVSIIAKPGSTFTFTGRVVFLDMHIGQLSVEDPRDKKNYDVSFDPRVTRIQGDLREGSQVTITAIFRGTGYVAESVAASAPASGMPSQTVPEAR
jgi:hypothetical protein